MPTLNINGKDTAVDADESTPILWALRDYRRWAIRLARPAWRKHAKTAVHYLARNRRKISTRLGLSVRSTFPD